MNLCSGRAHLNSPGSLVCTYLVACDWPITARRADLFHYLAEISRHQLDSGPSLAIPWPYGFPLNLSYNLSLDGSGVQFSLLLFSSPHPLIFRSREPLPRC
jgi:hypothetical protein